MVSKWRAGIIGATGMVGQRFVTLLSNHPMFEITVLAASARSSGQTYANAVDGRWKMATPLPQQVADMIVYCASDVEAVCAKCDFVFCAVDMKKDEIKALEEAYAKAETPVVSNNSANRTTPDVPMVIPEINFSHLAVIEHQKARLGTKSGFIAVKPNCSIQSYVPMLTPLLPFGLEKVLVCTYQAISGAGKTFRDFPEMTDNVIPFIGGEEQKSETEPLRIWGDVSDGSIVPATSPIITTQCIRVPVTDGHTAAVFFTLTKKVAKQEIIAAWRAFECQKTKSLPSAPERFITYFEEENRPQARLDRDLYGGMGVCCGRLREDPLFDYKFVGLSHNTLRGAAGGSVLIAELLCQDGYIPHKA